jgi:HSP20 family molecular chaperone IbpA
MSSHNTKQRESAENVSERPFVSPYVDVFENEQEILVVADLPGVAKEDLSIRLEEGELSIEARRMPRAAGTALTTEYRASDFRRSFVLPQGIDRDKVDAHLAAGVLRLKLPKQAALRPRRIEVRAG